MKALRIAGCAALAILWARSTAAQEPTLESVLSKARAYVAEFQRTLAGIVAQERYVQNVDSASPIPVRHRELTSDLLLVRPVGADRWVQFRDVFDVDGKPVRDRNERLAKLFLEPTRSTADQVRSIVAESTRYNIGNLQRTVNVPVMPLVFLDPRHQARFTFSRTTNVGPSMSFPRNSTAAWTIQYQEADRDTIIRGTNGFDLPARGRFWIEADTGRILMSELIAEDVVLRAMIVVKYIEEPSLGLLVPAEMRERYNVRGNALRGGSAEVQGTATYSNFRRFTVTVDEKLAPVVKP
jgi:hypothetical protein